MAINKYLTRQSDLIPESVLGTPITIIGAGAIGSLTALTLAKMGFHKLTVFDDDKIEHVNINNQFYRLSDIGSMKVDALASLIKDFTDVDIVKMPVRASGMLKDKIVISAVDSMKSRKEIFDLFYGSVLIDPRMAIEYACIRTFFPADRPEDYTNSLHSDEEAVAERCTAKATMYTASLLAGQTSKIVLDYVLGRDVIRSLEWDIGKNNYSVYVERK